MKTMGKVTTEQKNILIYVNHIKLGGGVERVAVNLGNELIRDGNNVTLCVLKEQGAEYSFNGQREIIDDEIGKGNPISALVALFKRAYRIKQICKKREIHTVVSFAEAAGTSAVMSKLFGNKAKIITSVHNDPRKRMRSKIQKVVSFLYGFADKVVAVSKGVESVLRKKFSWKNTITIYNSMDFSQARNLSKKALPKDYHREFTDNPTFVNVGRMVPQKAQWRLIRAFSGVVDKLPQAKLIILGDGKWCKKLEQLIANCGLEGDVTLAGNQKNVFPFMKKADYFVFSSQSEGFGIVLLEALAVDTSVISTDCDFGPREIVAPNYAIDKRLNYPYSTKRGTLVENDDAEPVWKAPVDVPLTKTEQQLADQMASVSCTEDSSYNLEEFSNSFIFEKWKEIL